MSEENSEPTVSGENAETTAPAAPKKRVAKKATARKTTGKTAANEPAAEATLQETAKPARKTVRKKAVTPVVSSTEDLPEENAKPAAKKRAVRATKSAGTRKQTTTAAESPAPEVSDEPVPSPAPAKADENSPQAENSQPKFGRVPGGGPRPREDQPTEKAEATSEEGLSREEIARKRRRDKRKRRAERKAQLSSQGGNASPQALQQHPQPQQKNWKKERFPNKQRHGKPDDFSAPEIPVLLDGPKTDCDGMLELAPKGFGFLRVQSKNYEQARDDVFVPPDLVRKNNLRRGQWIHGKCQESNRGLQLVEITTVNDMLPAEAAKLPHFDELKAINPTKRISFETTPERYTTRVLDIMAPIGRGQRGLIVSPPRSGKTTLLLHIAEAIREKYDESIHLMVLLVDERPEEVTEFRRALPGAEIYASSNDENARSHCRIAEMAIERAKRLVEAGKDVFLLMDSITRLARAYNNSMGSGGGHRNRATGSGGIMIGALEVPRRLFAAARNTRGGGSLTVLATALVQTNSRADEAIFMEFKGTGNMELVLDRKIAENYLYPAADIFKSGTRREELLIPEHMLHKIHLIRRGLSGHRPAEAMERLLFFLKKFPNNPQMLLEIKG